MKEESVNKRKRQKGKESGRARCVKDSGGNKEKSVKKRKGEGECEEEQRRNERGEFEEEERIEEVRKWRE